MNTNFLADLFREEFEDLKLDPPSSPLEEEIQNILRTDIINFFEMFDVEVHDRSNVSYEEILKKLLGSNWHLRTKYNRQYTWAIPSLLILREITKNNNIIEIYAGTGYWANLISKFTNISCYDNFSSHYDKKDYGKFYKVENMNNLQYELLQNCTLFMSWIPYQDTECIEYITKLHPSKILLLGEFGGCTASNEFFDVLNKCYQNEMILNYPTWPGLHDCFSSWIRK